jgi:hypothetical protein
MMNSELGVTVGGSDALAPSATRRVRDVNSTKMFHHATKLMATDKDTADSAFALASVVLRLHLLPAVVPELS